MTVNNSNADVNESDLISALQRLGENGHLTAEIRQVLSTLDSSGINCSGPTYWDTVCAGLSQAEQANLFRGLVIAERDLGLTGGAVSATSKLFGRVSDSMPLADAYSLAIWSAETSPNPYTPISSMNAHGILRSFREHILNSDFRNFSQAYESAVAGFERNKRSEYKRKQEEVIRLADERQSQRVATKEEKQARRDEKSIERLVQIQAVEGLSPSDKLRWLASTALPLPSIPFDLFEVINISDVQLTRDTLDRLLSKLQGHKMQWKTLYDALKKRSDSLHS